MARSKTLVGTVWGFREGRPGCPLLPDAECPRGSWRLRLGRWRRRTGPRGFVAQKPRSLGHRPARFRACRPGRSSKPLSVSGNIRLRALLDGQGNSSSRQSGLAPGEAAVSSYPGGTSGAPPSPYRRTVSFLLRSSDSRPSGSDPTPCFPARGLSSAAGRCRLGPPSAALYLLANRLSPPGGKGPGSRPPNRITPREVATL